ncbi:MAG: RNA polymerase subunit sigma-70, partial [Chloroflexota bacterium]
VDYLRKKSKRQSIPLEEVSVMSSDDPQHITDQNYDIERLALATRKLTDLQSEVISLRFTGELSTREVARIMG